MFEIGKGLRKIFWNWAPRSQALIEPGDEERITEPRMQNRSARKEVVSSALMDDEKADLVAHICLTAEHHLFSLAERLTRKKSKTKR